MNYPYYISTCIEYKGKIFQIFKWFNFPNEKPIREIRCLTSVSDEEIQEAINYITKENLI